MDDRTCPGAFALDLTAHRVVWGWRGGRALIDALDHVGIDRFMLIASARGSAQFDTLVHRDAAVRQVGRFTEVVPHVPQWSADAARAAARGCGAEGLVVFGAGAALDTAKAVSHPTGMPIVAVPTNFSGSEVTWNYGLTVGGAKRTMRAPAVVPRVVIYETALVETLSLANAMCSGVNAIAHAIEALYAAEANPLTQAVAESGIANLVDGLRQWADAGFSEDAGAACLRGAWLCGEALSQVGMGLHHRICHILGGTYGLPHAATHTVLLPYLIELNRPYVAALTRLDSLFDGASFSKALAGFAAMHGAPASLEAIGLAQTDLADVASAALATPVVNPRSVGVAELEVLLRRAWHGDLACANSSAEPRLIVRSSDETA